MKTTHALMTIVLAASLMLGFLGCASSKSQAELQARAKISQAEAQRIALEREPEGIVKEVELEEEHGKLVWSFDLGKPGTKDITEIHVDAITGAIVLVEQENEEQEKAEAKAEKRK